MRWRACIYEERRRSQLGFEVAPGNEKTHHLHLLHMLLLEHLLLLLLRRLL